MAHSSCRMVNCLNWNMGNQCVEPDGEKATIEAFELMAISLEGIRLSIVYV